MGAEPIVVCVPARNEAERLPILLGALAAQTMPATIVIALNNTCDASRDVIARARERYRLNLIVDDVDFPAEDAHAGSARRRAMEVGAEIAGASGILISTDADTRPPPQWVEMNAAALARGLDMIGGQIRVDDAEAVTPAMKALLEMTANYWETVRAIEDSIDPVSWDAPPRHGDHTGASLSLRAQTYRDCGGVPAIPREEDRALVRAVCMKGGRLGHPPDVWTLVSMRVAGRASAGMADEIARLTRMADIAGAVMLPHFRHWEERARWRRDIRDRLGAAEIAVREHELPPLPCDMPLTPKFVCSAKS